MWKKKFYIFYSSQEEEERGDKLIIKWTKHGKSWIFKE